MLNIKRAEKEEISWEVFSTSFFFLGLVTLVTPDATGEEGKSYIIKPILQRHGHYYVSKVALRDLFGRFAALKNSLPSHNRKIEIDSFYIVRRQQEEESNVEEAEVEKVIK